MCYRNDAYAAYNALAELGIEHCDVRLGNILKTLDDSPITLPGIPLPTDGRVLKCRIIDFELSRKTTGHTDLLRKDLYDPLNYLMDGLPGGDILNQKLY